ncbi:galactinol synthase [Pyrenophora seminiperda CCB06]|uniref:Galactinol synthase n=1 Tax=Pyrenophora seminiperda CCB06 TaxID=1302712 RepID=A0A3M7M904_9PLEO|nr:galactinol synthase [Pyrenophora seminiperda CCB06]
MSPPDQPPPKNAYITLLTRPSYLAGALLLAYTLTRHSPTTPLIITYTPSTLPSSCIAALQTEAQYSNIRLHPVEHLRLPDPPEGENGGSGGMVAERFADTWTKLRVFDIWAREESDGGGQWDTLCWLDADMMIFSDPSPMVFGPEQATFLKGGDGLRVMAVHTCVCNLDADAWAPREWKKENCAMSDLTGPEQLATVGAKGQCYTRRNFNSGTFCWRPGPHISSFVKSKFEEVGSQRLRGMAFPDQDFLNEAFDNGRWGPLSWKVNALKTWRYWHRNFWVSDDDVAVCHYIVDKPWAARVGKDGVAGYKGEDGVTHTWWWEEFSRWEEERKGLGEGGLLDEVKRYVAGEEGGGEVGEEMRAIGGGAQGWAKKWEGRG